MTNTPFGKIKMHFFCIISVFIFLMSLTPAYLLAQQEKIFQIENKAEVDIKKFVTAQQVVYNQLCSYEVDNKFYQIFSGNNEAYDAKRKDRAKSVFHNLRSGNELIKLEIRKSGDINNVWGAFTSSGSSNEPVIYINESVIRNQGVNDISRILLEEIGHWIDYKVNGAIDTKGDEGQLFAFQVLGIELGQDDLIRFENENDHLNLTIDGIETEVELAALLFEGQSYFAGIAAKAAGASSTGPAGQIANLESNTLYIGNPLPGGRALFVSDPANAPVYSGNNVRGNLYAIDNNNKITAVYYGEISRLIKEGSAPVAAQMYIYTSGTITNVQATTIVVDFFANRYPTLNTGDVVKTSSDPVSSALNSLLAVNTAPQANADTDVSLLANCNPVRANPTEATGNVISGLGSDNNTAGRDIDTDLQYIVNLYSPIPNLPPLGELIIENDPLYVTAAKNSATGSGATVVAGSTSTSNFSSVVGRYGTLKIGADGSYKYTVNGTSSAVLGLETGQSLTEVFSYDITDRKGGISNISLTISINGGNEAPKATNEYQYVQEASTTVVGSTLLTTTTTNGGLLINDTDPDAGNTLKITQAENATSGTDETFTNPVTVTATGAVNFSRTIGYTYTKFESGSSWSAANNNLPVLLSRDGGINFVNTGLTVVSTTSGNPKTLTISGPLDYLSTDIMRFGTSTTNYNAGSSGYTPVTISQTKFVLTNTGTAPQVSDAVSGQGVPSNTKVSSITTLTFGATTYTYITLDKSSTVDNGTSSSLDAGESLTFTQGGVIQGTYGYLNLKSDGTYSYVLTADIPNDQLVNEYFKYQISDASNVNNPGCTDIAVLHIQIQGLQTAPPTIVADAVDVIETGVVAGTSPLTRAAVNGLLSNDAIGSGGTSPLKVAKVWTPTTTGNPQTVTTSVTLTGTYGSIIINADGSYTYTLNNANATVDALNATQTLTEVFYYQGADNQTPAKTNISSLTITIKGANDAPVATDDGATAIEGGNFSNANAVDASGSVLPNDTDVDNNDTKTVSKIISGAATPSTPVSNGTTVSGSYGTLTINPNGTYTYTVNNTNPTVDALKAGQTLTETFSYEMIDAAGASSIAKLVITIQGADDNVKVNNVSVNEGSPYIVFTVTGAAGQKVTLDLGVTGTSTGDATGSGVDFGSATGTGLEYFDGTAWQPYTANSQVTLDANGKLLVRTAVKQDATYEQQESFTLNASTVDGYATAGAGVIYDDGTGDYFAANNTTGTSSLPNNTILDDDRALTVSDVTVNEASPYATFTVTGVPGQKVTLTTSITNQTAEAADFGGGAGTLQYFNTANNTWTNYTPGAIVTLGADGTLLVRTAITVDSENEGPETFKLIANNTGGVPSTGGTGTIKDDGTGDYFDDNNNTA
ncbi:MAG: beta strand repeat-containing protein, partial [Chitinophagaceae bacterium]